MIDDGLISDSARSSLTTRCQCVSDFICRAFEKYPKSRITPFTIFYGTRLGVGTQPNSLIRQKAAGKMNFDEYLGSWFGCQSVVWDGSQLKSELLEIPQNRSQYIAADGTGKKWVEEHQTKTAEDPQYRTSRIIFRGFCNSLGKRGDAQSGGFPQLVGIYRSGPAKTFGIITNDGASYLGIEGTFPESKVEWRNEDFERVHMNGGLVAGGKRHGFKF